MTLWRIQTPLPTERPAGFTLLRQLADALWFGRSVRTQLLIVFILVNLVAGALSGAVIIYRAGVSTRLEIAASMRLAEVMASEAVQLIAQGMPADQVLKSLPMQMRRLRHVRIYVREATGGSHAGIFSGLALPEDGAAGAERAREAGEAPAWFAALIGPPREAHDVPIVVNGTSAGKMEIVSEPRDEIAEAWENSVALCTVAAATVLLLTGILYLVLGRVLDPLRGLANGLLALERRDFRLRLARPKGLDAARSENLALNARLITAQDDERRRTALELHDEVGPSLFGLKANLASIAKATSGLPQDAAAVVTERVGELTAIVDHLQGINRDMLNRLRPMALGHVPLREILTELIDERARQHPGIDFTCELDTLERSYGDTMDLTIYRCVQESLTNALRHAGAGAIEVRAVHMWIPADGAPRLELTVRDDGSGFFAGAAQGFGLRGMRERVEALGGSFTIENKRGTCVRIAIALAGRGEGEGDCGPKREAQA
jgi:two-component system, NarL family, sensor histidine kinase UhpB